MFCFGGIVIMMCLFYVQFFVEFDVFDVVFVGVFFDIGIFLCFGICFGFCEICVELVMICFYNMVIGVVFFDLLNVVDIGDVVINIFNLLEVVCIIEQEYDCIFGYGIFLLIFGGDYIIILLIFCVIKKKYGKVGLVYVDVYVDVNDYMFGEKIVYGIIFCCVVEEDLLDCDCVVQIGLCVQGYIVEDFNWSCKQGFCVVQVEECWYKLLELLMVEVCEKVGGGFVYLSFDIDGIDLVWVFGIGILEIGGLIIIQVMEIICGCQGLDLIGCDLVEVLLFYDIIGNILLLGVNLFYEMFCVFLGVVCC